MSDDATIYGAGPLVWTEYTSVCRGCGRTFRISQQAIFQARVEEDSADTDKEVAESLDWCLRCVDGDKPEYEGETPFTISFGGVTISGGEARKPKRVSEEAVVCYLSKVAMIRDDRGRLVLRCPCGDRPETPILADPKGEVVCSCGRRYTTSGKVLPPVRVSERISTYCGSMTEREYMRHIEECGVCGDDDAKHPRFDLLPCSACGTTTSEHDRECSNYGAPDFRYLGSDTTDERGRNDGRVSEGSPADYYALRAAARRTIRDIDAIDRASRRAEYTNTDDVWRVFDLIRADLKAALETPKRVSERYNTQAYTVGDIVEWLWTEGGGGGSGQRTNTKTARRVTLLALTDRSAKIETEYRGATWVRRSNIRAITDKAMVRESAPDGYDKACDERSYGDEPCPECGSAFGLDCRCTEKGSGTAVESEPIMDAATIAAMMVEAQS